MNSAGLTAPSRGVPPAAQRLGTDHAALPHVELRLVFQRQGVVLDGRPQVAPDHAHAARALACRGVELAHLIGTALARLGQADAGGLHQRLRGLGVARVDRDADVDADLHLQPARRDKLAEEPSRRDPSSCAPVADQLRHADGELVARQAGQEVVGLEYGLGQGARILARISSARTSNTSSTSRKSAIWTSSTAHPVSAKRAWAMACSSQRAKAARSGSSRRRCIRRHGLALRARAHRQAAWRTAVGAAHQPLASPDGATAAASAAPPGAAARRPGGRAAQRQPGHAGQHEHADGEPDRRQRREGVQAGTRHRTRPAARAANSIPAVAIRPASAAATTAVPRARAAATGPWRPPRHPRRTPQRRPAALAEVQQAAGSQHDPGGHADRGAGTQQEHPLCVADPHLPGMRFPPAAPQPQPEPEGQAERYDE